MKFPKEIAKLIKKASGCEAALELIEIPKDDALGDYAFPCFALAPKLKKSPVVIAKFIAENIDCTNSSFSEIKAKGPYVNFFLDKSEFIKITVNKALSKGFGKSSVGKGKTVVIDFSAPNIAKPFGIGHLRSTVIGGAIYRLLKTQGYKCIGINHIGDWGTQFGKLIVAYRKWGKESRLKKNMVKYLYELYVKFHVESEKMPELEDEAREELNKLEKGDKDNMVLWKLFTKASLEDFERIYEQLHIKFDIVKGESAYNEESLKLIDWCIKKGIAKEDEGALVIEIKDTQPLLLRRRDGATLYATRDLAAAKERVEKYKPESILYVVGAEQKLHFKQVFSALGIMGFDENIFEHIDFGLYRFPEGKMSTRKGRVVLMEDVLKNAEELVMDTINRKNPKLKGKRSVARQVGTGAIVFFDLSTDRKRDVLFDWDRILDMEGETGPYVQYTHARIRSLLKKANKGMITFKSIGDCSGLGVEEFGLAKQIGKFPHVIREAGRSRKPHILVRYLLDLCQSFNEFYQKCKIIGSEHEKQRLVIAIATANVIKKGLGLLGIDAPEMM